MPWCEMMGTSTHDTKCGRRLPTVSGWTRRLSPVLNGGYEIHSYALSSSIVEGVSPILDKRVTTKSQFEGLYRRKYCISLTSVAEGSACLSVNNKHTETCKIARPVWNLCFSFLHRCRCDFRGTFENDEGPTIFQRSKMFFGVTSGPRIVQSLCNIQSGKE